MINTDVLVIGGSATGLVAGMTAKSNNPEKSVTVIRKEEKVMIPCGIPYIFGSVDSSDNNILPDAGLIGLGVDIVIDEVLSVDTEAKTCKTKSGEEYSYGKLIMGTGSMPAIPKWLKGTELDNVFTIPKNKVYLDDFHKKLENFNNIVVVGAGFIGVEVSDEINKTGKNVTLVEILPNVLGATFDAEFASKAEDMLVERGVNVKTNCGIQEILGDGKVESVKFADDTTMEADAVILSLGYMPNTTLAKEMGLALNEFGFIKADQYRRTSVKDVFAAGDCAEKVCFSTGKLSKIMLASTACTEARIAGLNLYDLNTFSTFKGTIGVYSTCIGDTGFGVAGLIEQTAVAEGFKVVTGEFTGMNRHPGKLAGAHSETVKLIVSEQSGLILGGEVMSGSSAGELTNVMGFAIQNNMTINDLLVTQIGTQPMLTASPAGYPLIKAAEVVAKKLKAKKAPAMA
ncbi:NADPH-dependent 2,4-dienoyl-CoA reductase, sulfur reductase [Dethiosulfatibacter aminovorans DSM 17477]|uniref:NADPH-dependent 2,4-dienoyl-CoA reductase, sulfur reductase n=2 Tax=Dethiosulfatibacter TaxID=448125 RepID=A0A1M6LNT2_9FIRM|nr:NADPH-dependent 2,4-dienoyl-CoA reductase, sulfur reductase [Dethiosulfatibacter aminovorans DSM 17477]